KEQEVLAINKQLDHLASHDDLTRIFNRRYLETLLVQEHTRYLRYKEVYCIAMIDIDYFTKINDNYGHDAGDNVLIEFTRRVLLIIRKTDHFARFGGEEFALLIPNTIEKNALMLMERIRTAIVKEPYLYNGKEIPFTVSIGLTEVQRSKGDDAFKQLSLADRELYEAKYAGRNRVCVYQDKELESV
ncbi:MAG: GGDEF domain-containing protein, partial [Psychromonas sp.]|nr:GGDEF domain-containing protein [Psychromonas sp.]